MLKFTPAAAGDNRFKDLPSTYLMRDYRVPSGLYQHPYTIDEHDNLPDRCDSLAQAVIDNLKIQYREDKGSAVAATNNHIAQLLFMLSHYVADAHMPLHCDSRRFSSEADINGHIEGGWEHAVEEHFQIDDLNRRFFYDQRGYPLPDPQPAVPYAGSVLAQVETELGGRPFRIGWGGDNANVWDFMTAVCQHSYLMAYALIPPGQHSCQRDPGQPGHPQSGRTPGHVERGATFRCHRLHGPYLAAHLAQVPEMGSECIGLVAWPQNGPAALRIRAILNISGGGTPEKFAAFRRKSKFGLEDFQDWLREG